MSNTMNELNNPGKTEVAPPANTGWTAMDKTVRDFDEAVIKDYKEDLDTLLVFAGLFSAVMTAFIIESYKALSEDPTETSAQMLKQISMQISLFMASVNNGTANPVVPQLPDIASTFQAPRSAVRVNVLWFTSLILSLVTASLGILVKSWLHGYLASDHTSPKMRLRVRFFRYLGLHEWGVFEIAALLPLLIQVALGLFFLGLCFFTFSVNPRVGIASIVVVSMWALLVVVSIALPIFASRCPYRIPLPGNLFTWIRRNVIFRRLNKAFNPSDQPLPSYQLMQREYKSHIKLWMEEDAVAQAPWLDHHIIIGVDHIQADDQLLATSIIQSYKQTSPPRDSVIPFALRFLQARNLIKPDHWNHPQVPVLPQTTTQLWQTLSTLIADTIAEEIVTQHGEATPSEAETSLVVWRPWMIDGILLIVCNAHLPRPSTWVRVLSLCTPKDFCRLLCTLPDDLFEDSLHREQRFIALWETHEFLEVPDILQRLRELFLVAYRPELQGNTNTLLEILHGANVKLYNELGRTITDALFRRINNAITKNEGEEWLPDAVAVTVCLFKSASKHTRRQLMQPKWLLHTSVSIPVLEEIFRARSKRSQDVMNAFTSSYQLADMDDRAIIQNHVKTCVDNAQNGSFPSGLGSALWALRTILDQAQIAAFTNQPTPSPCWSQIWSRMASLITEQLEQQLGQGNRRELNRETSWYKDYAIKCAKYMMDTVRHELHTHDPLTWINSAFPQEFMRTLANTIRTPVENGIRQEVPYDRDVTTFLGGYP